MRILLAGAGGQLGRALQASVRAHDLVALDHSQLDITQLAAVREAIDTYEPNLVINAAAFSDVDGAETHQEEAYAVNGRGPRNLALASVTPATAARHIALLHVSTDYVFDGACRRPYHEFDRPNPLSVYGASKWVGEEAVRVANWRHYIVRTAWLYSTVGRNFANTMRSLADRPEVRVVNDQHGSPTYAPHLAEAIARLIETDAYGTYHLAGGGEATWYELTCALFAALGITTPVRPVPSSECPRPAKRPRYSVLTTLQDPTILLPRWEEGVAEFARAVRVERTS